MPQEESKPVDQEVEDAALNEAVSELKVEQNGEAAGADEDDDDDVGEAANASDPKSKKKKSKRKKLKDALASVSSSSTNTAAPASTDSPLPAEAIDSLSSQQLASLMAQNPALAQSMPSTAVSNQRDLREALKKFSAADLVTGMSKGKNAKDMANYRFWATQPVPRFDDPSVEGADSSALVAAAAAAKASASGGATQSEKKAPREGPIQMVDIDKVSKEGERLVDGFEWSEIDIEDAKQLAEVQDLLCNHYVEDDEAMFRFNYSNETLFWALKAPGWRRSWHVGVRASKSQKLVAFISAIPVRLRVRQNAFNGSEVNFLCVHKKLRSKRLAPQLIKEITRRCNVEGVFQAIFTAGVVLPKPVASPRYFHRALDWEKLYSVGFSPLPHGSTKARQVLKYKLPDRTATPGLRLMEAKDVDAVSDLLSRYLQRMDLAQEFSKEEVLHWLLDKEKDPKSPKRVVWTYVVEDAQGKMTDFFSFYCLESTVIQGGKHSVIRAAYMFYYGAEAAFQPQKDDDILRVRLNQLVKDALILAKQASFDVFNGLTLLDNPLFLTEQKFGAGDGQLHYYLFNYRTADIASGVDEHNKVDDRQRGGVGVVML